jgi:hypothetical protein
MRDSIPLGQPSQNFETQSRQNRARIGPPGVQQLGLAQSRDTEGEADLFVSGVRMPYKG